MTNTEDVSVQGVDPEVANVIRDFVLNRQSFISLDVYCKLGVHFNDDQNPIHEQVRRAYGTRLMPNYLCKWVLLKLEGGGHANVWKYYLPEVQIKEFKLHVRADGRVELTKQVLGSFSLLEMDLGVKIEDGKITYSVCDGQEESIINAGNRVRVCFNMLKKAGLSDKESLKAVVYPNKIEIVER